MRAALMTMLAVSYLTYVWPAVKPLAFATVNQYRHLDKDEENMPITVVVPPSDLDAEGIRNLRDLEDMGVVEPINWNWSGSEELPSSLSPEEQGQAEKLMGRLTYEELAVLDASLNRTERQASEYLGMAKTTYRHRLEDARARAKSIVEETRGL
jgi:hypothetical protein